MASMVVTTIRREPLKEFDQQINRLHESEEVKNRRLEIVKRVKWYTNSWFVGIQ